MNRKIYSLDENSEKLSSDDIKKISNNFKVPLKDHQNTIIKTMIDLENTGEINFELESKIIRNEIILKEDVVRNESYYNLYYNERENNIEFSNIKYNINMNYGILADKVGAGKTFEIIGLICHTQVPKQHTRILSSGHYTSIKFEDTEECIKTNFIIVPHNLILQWKTVLDHTKLNYFMINKRSHIDNLTSVYNIFEGVENPEINPNNCIANYDVILISATMLDVFYNKFPDIKWSRLIIDEVNTIKLPVYYTIKANFIWYITATPSGIRWIRRNYIRDMIVGINKNLFNKIVIKNDDAYVTNSMALPELNQIIINCDTPTVLRMISDFVSTDIINMLNAGNIKDAIFKLNCNVDTDDNIINVIKNKLEKDIHNRKLELEYMERLLPSDRRTHDESIKKLKDKINSFETRLKNITERIKSLETDSCPICLDDIKTPTLIPCCNNLFCLQCLAAIINKKCPMCRNPFTMKDLHIINNEITQQNKVEKKLLSKKENLINIIKKKVNGKFLVFSNYENTNEDISKILLEENISYSKLSGNINVINNTIEKFKKGTIKVLLLNATNYGSGLNLQMASDIIIYHEMTTELQTQIIGRSQRMGRTKQLNVYYLIHDNEKVNCTNPNLNLNIFDENNENDENENNNNEINRILNYDNNETEFNIVN
jgi:superfamily II DNA or RNA helicase